MILYLHGFLSSAKSQKAQWFKHHFEEMGLPCFLPSYDIKTPQTSIDMIQSSIDELLANLPPENNQAWCIVGSSMGGYYGRYFAEKYQVPLVMINPALTPVPVLEEYLGTHENPNTGERFRIDGAYLESVKRYDVQPDKTPSSLILLDEGDEVIPYDDAVQKYQSQVSAQLWVYEGGNHAFQHLDEAWPHVKEFIERYLVDTE